MRRKVDQRDKVLIRRLRVAIKIARFPLNCHRSASLREPNLEKKTVTHNYSVRSTPRAKKNITNNQPPKSSTNEIK